MQTILGSGGAIGVELAKSLAKYTDKIRLVSRNPVKINLTDELHKADLLDPKQTMDAVKGSEIVYITVGFPYKLKTWRENWPLLIDNVINACIEHNSKLVFFDNIYMCDPNYLNNITEETPINPPSKKGEVRAQLVQKILEKVKQNKLTALIARAADYYGPSIKNTSMLTEIVITPLSKGKTANWMGNPNLPHSFTYTPDAAKATAILGNTEDAYNQVWNLPTAKNPYTGKQLVEKIAKELKVKAKYRSTSTFMLKILGIFVPILREMPEMMYQYNNEYIFNSNKFEKRFNFTPTSYDDGIIEIINQDYK